MCIWQYQPAAQYKSKTTYICTTSPCKSQQQPQPASVEPWAQYLVTWWYPYANSATLTVNCVNQDEIHYVSHPGNPVNSLQSPCPLRRNDQPISDPAQQRNTSQRAWVADFPGVFHRKEISHRMLIQHFQLLTTKMVIFTFCHVSIFCSWHIDITQSQTRRKMVNRKGGGPHFLWWWRHN